ncbi:MAG: serine--tRNA ligase, partial [Deltaproteobacteria bacterium]|nr:serine--tRNA ligase [Deltaproteobacteria bacterium]
MLDLKFVRRNPDVVKKALQDRGQAEALESGPAKGVQHFVTLDGQRRAHLTESEELKRQRNALSQEVGRLKKAGQDTSERQDRVRGISEQIKDLDAKLAQIEEEIQQWLLVVPNIPHQSVPVGKDEE